ncbi:hypothetical protein KI387_010240, partial [Taxus chinensis]
MLAKNDLLKAYKHQVWDQIDDFEAFNIQAILRKKNEAVDRLAEIGATFDVVDNIKRDKAQPHIHVIVRPVVPDNNMSWKFQEGSDDEGAILTHGQAPSPYRVPGSHTNIDRSSFYDPNEWYNREMGSLDGVIGDNYLETQLLNGHVSYEEDDEGGDGAHINYKASFKELEENYVNYKTAQWILFSLLLILAWGVGFIMLLYLPLRRYIVRQDFRSRKLYVTSDAIVYKVTKPVFIPCLGVTRREKHVLLPLVTDVVIEQGSLQAAFGIFSIRIENAGFSRPPPVDDVHIEAVVNPGLFRKAVLVAVSNLRKEHIAYKNAELKISINKEEELPTFSPEIYSSSQTWVWPHSATGLTSWQMSPVNSIEESNSFQSSSEEMLLHKMEEIGNLVK